MLRARESDQEANRAGRGSIEESASARGEIAEESNVVGRGWEGSVCDLSLSGKRGGEREAWTTGGGGVLSGELGLWGCIVVSCGMVRVIS